MQFLPECSCGAVNLDVLCQEVTTEMIQAILDNVPKAAAAQDSLGRTALHKLAAQKHLTLPLLLAVLPKPGESTEERDAVSKRTASTEDKEGRTALHVLCRRDIDFDWKFLRKSCPPDFEHGIATLDLPDAVDAVTIHCDENAMRAQERVRLGQTQDRKEDRTALHDAVLRKDVSPRLLEALLAERVQVINVSEFLWNSEYMDV